MEEHIGQPFCGAAYILFESHYFGSEIYSARIIHLVETVECEMM